jgi:catecholate siderophore receptor
MPSKLKPLVAFVASGLSISSHTVYADDQAVLPAVNVSATVEQQNTDRDYQPAISTVGGKTEAAVTDIPQTVTVVNKALMQAQGATSLADALRNAPGITIGGAEGGQIGNNINLRGFTARTDIYLDGFRDRGQYYRDVFDLEQVEVLQGPSSMLFGRGSTGGVINQVTKQAQLGHFTDLSGTLGTDGRLRATLDTNSQLSDTAAMRINVFGQNLQTTRDTMENRDFGFAPTIRFGIGGQTELTLSALLQHNRDMPDYGVQSLNGRPITPSRDTFYGESTDHTDQDITMLNATVKHRFNDNMTLRNQTQLNRYTTNAVETAPRALGTLSGSTFTVLGPPAFGNFQPSDLWVQMQSHDRNITDTSIDNQTDFISRFNTGFIRHDLILGLEIGRDTYSNQSIARLDPAIGYVNWVRFESPDTGIPDSVTVSRGNLATSSANTLGVYGNDTLSFGEQWKFITGIRHDEFRASINNTVSSPVGDTEQRSHFNSLREGLLYQPTPSQSYYVPTARLSAPCWSR